MVEESKKSTPSENRALRVWDSVQTRGVNRSVQMRNYMSEMRLLRKKFLGETHKFIFGEASPEYLDAIGDIEKKFNGKLIKHIVQDNGQYIYTEADLEEIKRVKHLS